MTGQEDRGSHDQETPLVSVVMATYGGDSLPFLRQAVESVLSQTCARLELVLVLDGAVGEDTRQYLDAVMTGDARVRLVRLPENRGPAPARNAGIARARGRSIALLDADDVARPDRLETQMAFLQATGADVVGSFCRLIDEHGNVLGERTMPRSAASVRNWACALNPIVNSTVFARAEVLKNHPFPEEHRAGTVSYYGEDYDLWVTLLRNGLALCNQPEYLVSFRTGPRFLKRRGGWSPFYTDLRTKLRTLPLYSPWKWPMVVAVSVTVASLRLLPAGLLALVYRLRGRLTFRGAP